MAACVQKCTKFYIKMRVRMNLIFIFLILDEPINGLDPQGINEVHKIIMEIHRTRGVTMMISSHILDELAKTATRFCVIKDGTVIKECPTEQFLSECGDRDINEYYVELINKA